MFMSMMCIGHARMGMVHGKNDCIIGLSGPSSDSSVVACTTCHRRLRPPCRTVRRIWHQPGVHSRIGRTW